jgi:tetratricopeptide (TPR) repeat protein
MDGNRKWDPAGKSGSEPHYYGYEYGEVQSGRMVNQDHLEWLMPEECIIWQEAWSPIFGLSDVSEVTEDAAFQLKADEMKLLIYPFTMATDVRLRFLKCGQQVKEVQIPGRTFQLQEIDLKDMGEDLADLEIKIVKAGNRSGSISLKSRCDQKKASELQEVPVFSEHSSESLADWAEFDHKLMNRNRAMARYKQSIELDSLNYRAHLGLGKLLLDNADFDGAKKELMKAIESYKWAGEAYLLISHIEHLTGNLISAEERAYEARYYGEKCRGNLKLGEVLISLGEYDRAKEALEEALVNNSRSLRTYALLSLCYRNTGNTKQALAYLNRTPTGALKDMMWYTEAFLAGRLDESQLKKELFNDEWRYLELGFDYLELGALDDANKLADAGISLHRQGWELDKLFDPDHMWNFTRKRENPLFYLLKGAVAERQGRIADASKLFMEGDFFEFQVNFNQMEMVPVVMAAAAAGNGYASFWLGNFYYHNMRPDEANAAWKVAAAKHPENPQIMRNLAVYNKYQGKDPMKSRDLLHGALKLNPMDLFIRRELIAVENINGAKPDDILKIYLDAPKDQRDSYLYQHGLLQAFKDAGKWQEAADYLSDVDRKYSDDVNSWYYFCVGYADWLIENNKPQESLNWIEKSSRVPSNLSNVNLPSDHFYRHEEYYISGIAYKMLGEKAKSQDFFRKVLDEQTDFLFNEDAKNRIQQLRFYVALSMKELGMDATARGMLGSINEYRLKRGLVVLNLEKSELLKWVQRDPLVETASPEH